MNYNLVDGTPHCQCGHKFWWTRCREQEMRLVKHFVEAAKNYLENCRRNQSLTQEHSKTLEKRKVSLPYSDHDSFLAKPMEALVLSFPYNGEHNIQLTCSILSIWTEMRSGRNLDSHQHYLSEYCSSEYCSWTWWNSTIQTTGSQRLHNLKK